MDRFSCGLQSNPTNRRAQTENQDIANREEDLAAVLEASATIDVEPEKPLQHIR